MYVRVKGGTARGDEDLCATCRYAQIRIGAAQHKTVKCSMFERTWNDPTVECNTYNDKRTPFLHDLKEIAWNVEPRSRERAGFRPVPEDPEDKLARAIEEVEG